MSGGRLLRDLVDLGVARAPDEATRKRIRLTNALSLFAALVMFASLPFDAVNAPRWMLAEDVLGGLAFLAFPALNGRGHLTWARLLCLGTSNAIVLGNAALLGRDSGAAMVFLALAALPFALFDAGERWAIATGVLLAVGCFVLADSDVLARFRSVSDNYSPHAYQLYSTTVTLSALLFILVQISRANARAERELRDNREHYRLVTEAARDAIVTVDGDGRIVFASPAAEPMFGHPVAELGGQPISRLTTFPIERPTAFTRGVGLRRDGAEFPIEISIGVVAHEGRTLRTAVVRDISQRVQAEHELEQTRQTSIYSAKMAALGEMSGNIAHEVNNPLAAIRLRAERLRRMAESDRLDATAVAKAAREIDGTVQRIVRIAESLRSFARDVEHDPLRPESVLRIVQDTVDLCAERFHQHSIELRVAAIPEDLRVECRGVQISQVLLNLLSNAHDAVETEATRWVRISAEPAADGAEVRIAVDDSGPGVPPALRARIMEPFFTTKEVGRGTGLGLSVSKGIAEAHGGHLTYDATAPHTRFVLTLRRAA